MSGLRFRQTNPCQLRVTENCPGNPVIIDLKKRRKQSILQGNAGFILGNMVLPEATGNISTRIDAGISSLQLLIKLKTLRLALNPNAFQIQGFNILLLTDSQNYFIGFNCPISSLNPLFIVNPPHLGDWTLGKNVNPFSLQLSLHQARCLWVFFCQDMRSTHN